MIEHYIQRQIIERLAGASSLRFSELKPKHLESNAFLYHVNSLIKQGLVQKHNSGYKLSDKGLIYVDSLSFSTHHPRKQPKISTLFAITNHRGEWLLAQRKYQPFIGTLMLVGGKRHFGEAPELHAQRELAEKVGRSIDLKRRGVLDVRIYHGKTVITHLVSNVYSGEVEDDVLPPPTHQFEYMWTNPHTSSLRLAAGTLELVNELTTSSTPFFLSLDLQDEDNETKE